MLSVDAGFFTNNLWYIIRKANGNNHNMDMIPLSNRTTMSNIVNSNDNLNNNKAMDMAVSDINTCQKDIYSNRSNAYSCT